MVHCLTPIFELVDVPAALALATTITSSSSKDVAKRATLNSAGETNFRERS